MQKLHEIMKPNSNNSIPSSLLHNNLYSRIHLPAISTVGNVEERKRKNEEIENQNCEYLKRLRGIKSVFDVKKWESERKKVENYLEMITEFPQTVRNSTKSQINNVSDQSVKSNKNLEEFNQIEGSVHNTSQEISKQRGFELKPFSSGVRVVSTKHVLLRRPVKIDEEAYFLEIKIEDNKFKIIAENVEQQQFSYEIPTQKGFDILIHNFNEDIDLMAAHVQVDKNTNKLFILRKKTPLEISAENAEKRQKTKSNDIENAIQPRYLEPKKNYEDQKLKNQQKELEEKKKEKEKQKAARLHIAQTALKTGSSQQVQQTKQQLSTGNIQKKEQQYKIETKKEEDYEIDEYEQDEEEGQKQHNDQKGTNNKSTKQAGGVVVQEKETEEIGEDDDYDVSYEENGDQNHKVVQKVGVVSKGKNEQSQPKKQEIIDNKNNENEDIYDEEFNDEEEDDVDHSKHKGNATKNKENNKNQKPEAKKNEKQQENYDIEEDSDIEDSQIPKHKGNGEIGNNSKQIEKIEKQSDNLNSQSKQINNKNNNESQKKEEYQEEEEEEVEYEENFEENSDQ